MSPFRRKDRRDPLSSRVKPTQGEILDFRQRVGRDADDSVLSPQALGHFTAVDQLRALQRTAAADTDLGFYARIMTLLSLPRTDPGDARVWVRENGPFRLVMVPHGAEGGLPWGVIPRMLLSWICTEAVRTKSPEITLGGSVLRFMQKVGVAEHRSGGRFGAHHRIQEQARRLFDSTIQVVYSPPGGPHRKVAGPVADEQTLWTHYELRARRGNGVATQVVLGNRFFLEVTERPVPIDLGILRSLTRSALGLDLYVWLTYRVHGLTAPLEIPWSAMYRQFSQGSPEVTLTRWRLNHFRTRVLRELGKIALAWPDLSYVSVPGRRGPRSVPGRLVIYPGPPSVPLRLPDGH